MIRYVKHSGTDYIVVDSHLEVDGILTPIQIQINVHKLKEEERTKIFRVASLGFNRILNFNKPKVQPKKTWWQKIFNK